MTGKHFNRLFVVSFSHMRNHTSYWVCACQCGNIKTTDPNRAKSCGCLKKEQAAAHCKRRVTHGLTRTRIHNIYMSMLARCHNPNSNNYARYGGRGIEVWPEWRASPDAFLSWAFTNGYADHLQLDRMNNEHGYSPLNCRWVTATRNQNNRTNNRILTNAGGEKHTLADWARINGIGRGTIDSRIKLGWSEHDAVTVPSLKPWLTKRRGTTRLT